METFLGRFAPYIYALLRIVGALMYMLHGTQKLFVFPTGEAPVPIASLAGAAGIIEVVCGTLIAIGLFGSVAAFIASGQMAVAYFMVHAPQSFWPTVNRGEAAVFYCFLFLYIAARGSGIWSVDAARKGTRAT
jgi:putative oxidoreductase